MYNLLRSTYIHLVSRTFTFLCHICTSVFMTCVHLCSCIVYIVFVLVVNILELLGVIFSNCVTKNNLVCFLTTCHLSRFFFSWKSIIPWHWTMTAMKQPMTASRSSVIINLHLYIYIFFCFNFHYFKNLVYGHQS